MIKIKLDKKVEDQFKKIYQDDQADGKASSKKKTSIIEKLHTEITTYLDGTNPKAHNPIVRAFLCAQFGSDPGKITHTMLLDYLLRKDLTEIIQSFWRSVSRVWTEKLAARGEMTKVTDEYAQVLGSWPAEKEKAMSRKKAIDRIPIITAVITKETLPLFANIKESDLNPNAKQGTVISNKTELKQVTLRFPDDLYKEDTGAIDILSGIFDYDFLDGSPRHQLISAMEIPVCPYCNRQYITSYSEDGDQMTTADLDHYYCKSIYPFLALSLYNFIPSCQICNSRFKLAKDFYLKPHLYPYDGICGNEVKFRLANDRLLFDESAWNKKDDPFLKIETRGEAAANAKATFHLEEVYESHREYVHEIAWKNMVYSEEMIASLQKDFSGLFDEERDVRDLIFGQYINDDEAYKRPLGKLTKDILDEINKSK